ncbi:hypothetical protein E0L20_16085 [Enterobacter wuhouensis]|uniref:Uncharacterized protein n=1 Tax=Enterobacter wuhouensis TaxID=2529381 RepID=A0A4R0G4Y2_9ENTR|nr:hypothetical protein E0L20_16085 [Enterobacter wuhouensis]
MGKFIDIIMLTNRYCSCHIRPSVSAFGQSRLPVLTRNLFLLSPLDSMIFFRLFSNHATSVAASLGRSGR